MALLCGRTVCIQQGLAVPTQAGNTCMRPLHSATAISIHRFRFLHDMAAYNLKLALVQVELPLEAFIDDWQPTPDDHMDSRKDGDISGYCEAIESIIIIRTNGIKANNAIVRTCGEMRVEENLRNHVDFDA